MLAFSKTVVIKRCDRYAPLGKATLPSSHPHTETTSRKWGGWGKKKRTDCLTRLLSEPQWRGGISEGEALMV